jgi:hypothetical protein
MKSKEEKWHPNAETWQLKLLECAQRCETLGKGHEAVIIHFKVFYRSENHSKRKNTDYANRAFEGVVCSSKPVREAQSQQQNQYLLMIKLDGR